MSGEKFYLVAVDETNAVSVGDGLPMQKAPGREPDFDGIKLYSRTAKDLLAFIRADREETNRRACGGVAP